MNGTPFVAVLVRSFPFFGPLCGCGERVAILYSSTLTSPCSAFEVLITFS
jgi:hypothetical protein